MGHSLPVQDPIPFPPQVFILFCLESLPTVSLMLSSPAKITDYICNVLKKSIGNHRKRGNRFLSAGQFYQLFCVPESVNFWELLDYLQKIGFCS